MEKFKFLFTLAFFAFLSVQSCCKKDCDPYLIDIQTGVIVRDSFFEHDTISGTLVARAIAPEGATFTWKVGSDVREFTQKELKLDFDAKLSGQTFELKLIVKFSGNDCQAARIDSIMKKFTIANTDTHNMVATYPRFAAAYIGKWRGTATEAPNDEFDVTIVDWGREWNPPTTIFQGVRLFNFPKGCSGDQEKLRQGICGDFTINKSNWTSEITDASYNAIYAYYNATFSCCGGQFNMYGNVHKDNRNKITITLYYKDGRKNTFTGKRL